MSYPTVKAAALAQLTAALPELISIEGQEPQTVQGMSLYGLLQSTKRSYIAGGEVTVQYTMTLRLIVPIGTDLAAAEATLDPYVNRIPAAIDADPTLGVTSYEPARCIAATTGYWTLGAVEYRVLDHTLTYAERGPLGTL